MKLPLFVLAFVALSSQAHAFDCAKASSRFEKAICADPKAHDADTAMSKAFSDLVSGADAKTRAQATAAQVHWLHDRDSSCTESKGAALSSCLMDLSDKRRLFLAGLPAQGPGSPDRIAPWFRFEKGGPGKAAVDMELLKFPDPKTPGERAFNAATAKYLEDISEPDKDDPAADRYAFSNQMSLVYASPKLVSAQANADVDGGGAHPNSYTANINLDVAAGRLLEFKDAFDAKASQKIFALCLDQVKAQKKEREGGDAPLSGDDLKDLTKNIADSTGDLSGWSFEAGKAEVTYNPYAVGAYAEGSFTCDLDYGVLRPLAKPGFPLP